MELFEMTAAQLSSLLKANKVSSVEVVSSFLDRIENVEPYLKAFITHTPAMALDMAKSVDQRRARGEKLHPLAGVPIAIKDNICTHNLRTTCASKMLENYVPPYDASVITSLKNAGLPIMGKTNMDEFAMGSSTENSAFFTTKNPWDLSLVPGGSSGGSAVAVSAGMVPLALGSDTGGSIRQPASLCGLTGLRPTYGRVSRYGLIPFASSLDQIGIMSINSLDNALLLGLIAGHDPLDSTSLPVDVPDYADIMSSELKKIRIGIIKQNLGDDFSPEVTTVVKDLISLFADNDFSVEEVSFPLRDYGLSAYYIIGPSEASSNLARYDGVRFGYRAEGDDVDSMFSITREKGFGPEVKRRIMTGTYALSAGYYDACYVQAMKVRTLVRRDYQAMFEKYDLLVGAATPTTAFKIGEKTDDPLQMYLSDICNINDALAGLPSLTILSGFSSQGLPVGAQLTAPPLKEEVLFQAASFLEEKRGRIPLRPKLELDEERGRR